MTKTLQQLADPNLNMHVSIRTMVSVNARVTGRSQSITVNMEVDCAGGNESGTDTTGGVTYEWRLVDGTYYRGGCRPGRGKPRARFPRSWS